MHDSMVLYHAQALSSLRWEWLPSTCELAVHLCGESRGLVKIMRYTDGVSDEGTGVISFAPKKDSSSYWRITVGLRNGCARSMQACFKICWDWCGARSNGRRRERRWAYLRPIENHPFERKIQPESVCMRLTRLVPRSVGRRHAHTSSSCMPISIAMLLPKITTFFLTFLVPFGFHHRPKSLAFILFGSPDRLISLFSLGDRNIRVFHQGFSLNIV